MPCAPRRSARREASPLEGHARRFKPGSLRSDPGLIRDLTSNISEAVFNAFMEDNFSGMASPPASRSKRYRRDSSSSESSDAESSRMTRSGVRRQGNAASLKNARQEPYQSRRNHQNPVKETPRSGNAAASNNNHAAQARGRGVSPGSARTADEPMTPSVTITTNDGSSSRKSRNDSGVVVRVCVPRRSRSRQETDDSSPPSSPIAGPSAPPPVRNSPPNRLRDAEREFCESLSSIERLQRDVGLAREPVIEAGVFRACTVVDHAPNHISNLFWPQLAKLFDRHDWQDKYFALLAAQEYDPEICIMAKLRIDKGKPGPSYEAEKTHACTYCVDNRIMCTRLIHYHDETRLCVAALPQRRRKGAFRAPTYWTRPAPRY